MQLLGWLNKDQSADYLHPTMQSIAFDLHSNVGQVLAKNRAWDNRKALVQAGLQRQWQAMFRHCAEVDATIKGVRAGNVWDELLQLSLWLGGLRLFPGKRIA